MLNISWGTKIAILYISFVLLMGTMVVICMNQKIELVTDDYYERELVFQDKINEMNNANALTERVTHAIGPAGIQLQFPTQFQNAKVTGEILFFRPSDKSKDFKSSVQLNSTAQQFIAAENLTKGMYKMKIGWTADNKTYFIEETIVIP